MKHTYDEYGLCFECDKPEDKRENMMSEPTKNEVNSVIDRCTDAESKGTSSYPSMSYEEGVKAALERMNGDSDEPPLDPV